MKYFLNIFVPASFIFLLSFKATAQDIEYISYPDFPAANSTWGSIGYNPVDSTVYIGVTNHKDKIGLFAYNTNQQTMRLNGFVDEMAHLRNYQWQGKIHSKIVASKTGDIYFATDGGESREEYLMDHPKGYAGGYLMKWDPHRKTLTNLGNTLQYESIKDVDIDPVSGNIYAVTYPMVHFIVYDAARNQMKDLGRLGSAHVPRVMFTDQWGNCYYVDWRQRLVKYERSKQQLVFARESLPAFQGTPGEHIITGVTGFAKDTTANVIYLVTYGAKLIAFHPQQDGIGKVEDLGGVFDGKKQPWAYYVPNLNIGNNGKLYYIVGGHGNYAIENKIALMEFNPADKKKRQLRLFAENEIAEATGSDVRDAAGNLYFAGRKIIPYDRGSSDAERKLDNGISVPFLIKFHPDNITR